MLKGNRKQSANRNFVLRVRLYLSDPSVLRGEEAAFGHLDFCHSIFFRILLTGILFGLAFCNNALADNIRPAYLDIEELESGAIRVVWKVPLNQSLPANFRPALPKSFKNSSPKKRLKLPNAIIEKWTMISGNQRLAGASIGIEGLDETNTEALVRIQLANGSLHRSVLRPTDSITTVPTSETDESKQDGNISFILQLADRWRYVLFFLAAWLLSLTPTARRRGIMLCAVALAVGSLCGHAVGRLPVYDKFFAQKVPTDMEAKRILQGLMLNTYRAFILDRDEEIYDVLARSVAGKFLNEVYLQNKEAMRIDTTDGAASIIDRLDIKSIESMNRVKNGAIAMVATWDVYGSVRHSNHIHYRCNTYKAKLTIAPMDNYWKLTGFQLLDEKRVI